jgi:[ribosomal protein S5]-alanine N-acetyltransferase
VATAAFVPPCLAVGEYVLRPFRNNDAADWYAYLADPRVTEHTSWPPITSEFITRLVERVIADYDEPRSLRWALARGDNDKLIGSCGYTRWVREQGAAELAYDLAPAYWGLGLMSAAVRAAVAWALQVGSFGRVDAFVMTTNNPSIAVLERTGFRREKMLAGHRVAHGVPRDFYLYSVVSHAG